MSHELTRDLTREIVTRLTAGRPGARVTYRDLAAQELPHFSHAALTRSDELEAARNAAVLEEFFAADTFVIGVPASRSSSRWHVAGAGSAVEFGGLGAAHG